VADRLAPGKAKKAMVSDPLASTVLSVRRPFDRAELIRQTQWIVAAACGLAFIPVLHQLLKPLVGTPVIDQAFLRRTFLLPYWFFLPEPLERLTFLLALVLVPLVVLGVLSALERLSRPLTDSVVRVLWMGAVVGSLGTLVGFLVQLPSDTVFATEFFPATPHPILRVCLGLILAACAYLFGHRIPKVCVAAAFVFVGSSILVAVALFTVSTTNEGPRDYLEGQNMDAVIYSVAQVTQGRAMLIDATNQYGLYPQFLEPLFRTVGLNVLSFTITMWLLMGLGLVSVSRILWKNIENRWMAWAAFLGIAYYGYLSSRNWLPRDPYLQYHPIRFVFPCLCLYIFDRYRRHPSTTAYYGSFVAASIAVLWNPDSGIAVFGAWMALLAYREFSSLPAASALQKTSIHFLRALIVILSVPATYSSYALIRYHAWPNWGLLAVNLPVFYQYGGMMLPMPPNHPWMLVIALYVLTLAKATWSLLHRENSSRQQLMLVTAVLGTGLFTYYQGRSHDNNLTLVCWPAILLLALYADDLLTWRKRREDRIAFWAASFVAYWLLYFLFLPAIMIPDAARAAGPSVLAKIHAVRANETGPISKDIKLIERYARPGQRVAILSPHAGVYHAETRTASVFSGPGLTEMLWRSQLNSLEKQIDVMPDVPVFVDLPGVFSEPFQSSFTPSLLESLLRGRNVIEQNLTSGGGIAVYLKAPYGTVPVTVTSLLTEEPDNPSLAHIFTSPAGYLMNGDGKYAGVVTSTAPPVKSRNLNIEILVRPQGRQTPWATIVSTHPGTAYYRGFVLHHVPEHEGAYVLVLGNGREWIMGPEVSLPSDVTSYVCVVLRDETAHIYLNGDSVAEFRVPGAMASSDFPISIGDWQSLGRPFSGRVIETYLSQGEFTPSRVAARWRSVRPKIQ
jgi:hypothetical protein